MSWPHGAQAAAAVKAAAVNKVAVNKVAVNKVAVAVEPHQLEIEFCVKSSGKFRGIGISSNNKNGFDSGAHLTVAHFGVD